MNKVTEINISEITIHPIKPTNKGLVGFASCAINDSFYIGNIAIYTNPNTSYRLVYPTKVLDNGRQIPCFYPFKKEIGDILTQSVADEYAQLMRKLSN